MLNFVDVSLWRGRRELFTAATFSLFRGEKVGVTGRNGSGKSTLLALVRGEIAPESGSFQMPSNLTVAHVAQELHGGDQPAQEFVLDGDAELRAVERAIAVAEQADDGVRLGELHARYASIGGYDAAARAARLMHGLGFRSDEERQPISAFSGGWRVRLNVARALMCRSDLLLLDEPTNHLDLDAIVWLEGWLSDYAGTLLLITHDREFLDRIADRIVNIEHGQAHAYRGNYSAFEEQRTSELAEQAALRVRQQREIAHMESFIERFRASASKARQAQSRIKALERMRRIAPAHVDSEFEFAFAAPEKLPRPLLTLEDAAVGYGATPLLQGINLTLAPGARLALLGRNGAGKSTLVKLLAGALPLLNGARLEARDLALGYFAQHQLEQLRPAEAPFAHLAALDRARGGNADDQQLRDFLAGFGFRGDRVFEAAAPFSGGEKARLVLALLTYQRPNLLLLDEPTNHLDLEMRQALALALQDYAGAVVMVSHDRHLLRVAADELWLVDAGGAAAFDGDLDDYERWLARSREREVPAPAPNAIDAAVAPGARVDESAEGRRRRRQEEAEQRALLAPLRAALLRHERELDQLSAERARVENELTRPEVLSAKDKIALKQLLAEQTRIARAIEAAESQWLATGEALEAAGQS